MKQRLGHFVVRISSADPALVSTHLAGFKQSAQALPLNPKNSASITPLIDANYQQIHKEVASFFAVPQIKGYPARFHKTFEIVGYEEKSK